MILHGDSLQVLKELPDNSIDAVTTDPPYGLAFMGKKWDYDVPSVELWREVLRVLKPGGHLLSFGGTRTYHRMVVAIEDAGFEIRDQIMWIYGSGFPKSLDVNKAIDKASDAERTEVIGINPNVAGQVKAAGSAATIHNDARILAPATDAAKQWQGWGTALKPANEPIVLARKPLEKGLTVAENVLKWGTGALNIDGTRIGTELIEQGRKGRTSNMANGTTLSKFGGQDYVKPDAVGRWPANLILDESAAAMLDEQSGVLKNGGGNANSKKGGGFDRQSPIKNPTKFAGDKGGASRFFYVAKASKRERNAGMGDQVNNHCTVKPVKLMEYLIKLVCPPNGIVLDPFTGSGTTGVAAINLGFEVLGIEREAEYVTIAEKRMENAKTNKGEDYGQDEDTEAVS